ncbi:MAG: formate dehydrogenase accessory protein FdhE [Gemmatimonadaceae bacterium]
MHGTEPGIRSGGRFSGAETQKEIEPPLAWRPWLRLVELVLKAAEDRFWDAAAPLPPGGTGAGVHGVRPEDARQMAPLLHGTVLRLNARPVRRLVRDLLKAAAEGGDPGSSLAVVGSARLDSMALMTAALTHDHDAIADMSAEQTIDAEALAVIAHLSAVPLLHACAKRLNSSVPETWMRGYCPICGAWPSLAELRGLERNRRLRCGRCASDWLLPVLHCPFCAEVRHDQLASLLPEGEQQTRRVDVCKTCNGYIKTFSVLRPMSLSSLLMQDLQSVELDIVAQERGYARPSSPAYPLAITIERVSSIPNVLARWT